MSYLEALRNRSTLHSCTTLSIVASYNAQLTAESLYAGLTHYKREICNGSYVHTARIDLSLKVHWPHGSESLCKDNGDGQGQTCTNHQVQGTGLSSKTKCLLMP